MSSKAKAAAKAAPKSAVVAEDETVVAKGTTKIKPELVAAPAASSSSSSSSAVAKKSVLPPCPVPEAQVLKAATALVNHIKAEKKAKGERTDLINEGVPLFVTIRQFRIPGREKSKPKRM